MVFSSISFVFFILPLFLAGDAVGRFMRNAAWRNVVLLSVSLLFYVWGEAVNLVILLVMGFLNYYGGRALGRSARPKKIMVALVSVNLLILFVFKYSLWLASIFYPPAGEMQLALPLGISFFTFHAVSYVLDIYRRDIAPAPGLLNFMAYFCMFPHLVAGPIVRYRQVRAELTARVDDRELFSFGMYRFLLGFNKKLLVANTVAPLADAAFLNPAVASCGDAWLGIAAYAIQIYFDFSAYSDMAIGLAAMAGFRFEENFRRPYNAVSVQDFWRRWHISLSSCLRDYLYIPLGGNRGGKARTFFNLAAVFLLCGLWHGADLTFVLWGLWHGLFLIIERLGLGRALAKAPALVGRLYAMLAVMTGWVFFRAYDTDQALTYLSTMFDPWAGGGLTLTYFNRACLGLALGVILCALPERLLPRPDSLKPAAFPFSAMVVQGLLFVPSMVMLIGGSRNPFIYFNF